MAPKDAWHQMVECVTVFAASPHRDEAAAHSAMIRNQIFDHHVKNVRKTLKDMKKYYQRTSELTLAILCLLEKQNENVRISH